jgi:hypothetical protein
VCIQVHEFVYEFARACALSVCMCVLEGGTLALLTLVGMRAVTRKARHDVSTYEKEAAALRSVPKMCLAGFGVPYRT